MTSQQIQDLEVTYHPEDIQNRGTDKVPDLRIYLPDRIGILGLGEADFVRLETRMTNGKQYIAGQKVKKEEPSDSHYEIYTEGSSRLRMTMPSKWRDDFIEDKENDILVVEVNPKENEFRIYKNEDYHQRLQELHDNSIYPRLRQKVIVPLAAFSRENESQKFRIIPFNYEHEVFAKVANELDEVDNPADPAVLHEIIDRDRLPRCKSPKLTVYWDPKGKRHTDINRRKTIFTDTGVNEVEIRLPAQGSFHVSANPDGDETWVNYGKSSGHAKEWELAEIGNWQGKYLREQEDHIALYVPCKPPESNTS